jgi:U3 small nucleolar RNA-associated protein 14
MPGRQSHGGAPPQKPKGRVQSKKRAIDAFAIASHQHPDKIKIRKHRLGTTEEGNRPGKRLRDEDDEDEDEDLESTLKKQRKGPERSRFDELDVVEGSDSEGNEWKLGEVDSDDDSDLDSDEAFGESDDERFQGFGFSGSSSQKKAKKTQSRPKNVNLNESDEDDGSNSELEEGDLGDDAVDLATMLDKTDESDEDLAGTNNDRQTGEDSANEETEESDDTDEEPSISSSDDDGTADRAKYAELQDLIASLPQTDQSSRPPAKHSSANEYSRPSDFALISKAKLTLEDLGLPTIKDPNIKKSLKLLGSDLNGDGRRKGPKTLDVPLAKRQQDRLDRSVAYEKTKETLDRWTDTVKHNRRADHLIFPLPDNDIVTAHKNSRLQPTGNSKPFNELEATIQSILEESGLATENGKDDEDHIREFEELETNKMTIEEVKARRDQLRMARELLFREEAKSKRIKKIKSKSYRKVHRKQREKEERLNQQALAEGGFVPSEDELEIQDRRRATERMGAKHRASKWAKATKQTGRAAWDEDARTGVAEMARRDEELRKRVEGRAIRREFENNSDSSFSDLDDVVSGNGEDFEQMKLLQKLSGMGDVEIENGSVPGSKLANMKFMLKAEANRKKENDSMAESIRRELAGEESPSEDEEDEFDVGRRTFGPSGNRDQDSTTAMRHTVSQEPFYSDDDGGDARPDSHGVDSSSNMATSSVQTNRVNGRSKPFKLPSPKNQSNPSSEGGAWSKVVSKPASISNAEAKRRRHERNNATEVEELDVSKAALLTTKAKPRRKDKNTSTVDISSDESNDESSVQLPFAIRDHELIKRAFAGADVVGDFEAEKRQTIEDEEEKVIDITLPGWGSWTGEGLSKKEKARNKGRFLTKSEGIKEENRKDAKLDKVIINEKRVKKVNDSPSVFVNNGI